MQRSFIIPTLVTALLISLVPLGTALAQQASPSAPVAAPPGAIRQLATRFAVVDPPARFDQVLQIVDFPAGTWTPPHTSGGYVYTTVIDGAISTRSFSPLSVYDATTANRLCDESADVRASALAAMERDAIYVRGEPVTPAGCDLAVDQTETTYQAGDTFVQRPGDLMQAGNASAANTRILATAVLPTRAPLTVYDDGFTSGVYPTLANWNYVHDIVASAPGPETVYRSVTEVDRPEGKFELVQLVLDLVAIQPPVIGPDGAHIAALYGWPVKARQSGDEVSESCLTAWGRLSGDTLSVYPHLFERVAPNLCVSSAYYVPFIR